MKHYTGCDAHKKYSVFTTISEAGEIFPAKRVEHDRQKFRSFLETLPTGSSIAIESVGNWYWLIDEPFASCHSEGAKRPKNLAQDKLRVAISCDNDFTLASFRLLVTLELPFSKARKSM